MELRNCPQCGKVFAFDGTHKVCDVCREDEEIKFQRVKEYLWEHPKASIDEVHEETEVEKELIIKFVKDDRLVAEGIDIDIVLECERCGSPITSGRFCNKCQQELVSGFGGGDKKSKKKKPVSRNNQNRMFTSDRIKKRNRDKN